jgi:copper(I)-binding protein
VPAAGYLSIRNESPFLEVLDSVRADVAERVELHRTDLEGDVMRMRRVGSVDVPSGKVVELAPGGLHLMLMDLNRPLEVGQTVTMELHFRRAGRVTAVAHVRTGIEG